MKKKEIKFYGIVETDAEIEEKHVHFRENKRGSYSSWRKKIICDYRYPPKLTWHIELTKANINFIERGWSDEYGEIMVSGKVRDILLKHKLPKHQFTPFDVVHNNKKVEYYMFTIFENHKDYIDWPNTEFYPRSDLSRKIRVNKKITFNSAKDYDENNRKYLIYTTGLYYSLVIEKLTFLNFESDIIYISSTSSISYKFFLSKRLSQALMLFEHGNLDQFPGFRRLRSVKITIPV